MATKKGQSQKSKLTLTHFVLVAAGISIIHAILIMFRLLPPVSDYFSIGTMLFNILRLLILVYAGVYFSVEGLKKPLLNGAIMGFAASVILVIFAYISKQCCNVPIFGMQVNQAGYWQVMIFLVLQNMVLWGIVAFVSGWITSIVKKRKS